MLLHRERGWDDLSYADLKADLRIVQTLADLCKAKLLFAVWVDGRVVWIKRTMLSEREPVAWGTVPELIEDLLSRRPVQSELESKFEERKRA